MPKALSFLRDETFKFLIPLNEADYKPKPTLNIWIDENTPKSMKA